MQLSCHLCKRELGRQHIVYQDYEGNRLYHYHEHCALIVKERVIQEFFELMCRVANHTLERRK